MKIEKIKSASNKKENFYVLITIIILLFIAGTLLRVTTSEKKVSSIKSGEISSLNLNNVEVSIFSELGIFLQDLPYLEENYTDLDIKTLEEELFYSPFVKDAAWEASGEHEWSIIRHDKDIYFIGISKNKNVSGDFIAIYNTESKDYKIKYKKDFSEFSSNVNLDKLEKIVASLEQVIAYTGDDFIKDMKGK